MGSLQGFFAKRFNSPLKQMVFRNMILSTLMSAMVSFNVIPLDLDRLHAKMMALARVSLAGRAAISNEGDAHTIKQPEKNIVKLMKLGSFEVELDIARLSFWKKVFRAPNHNEQLVTVMLGQFSLDLDVDSFKESSRYNAFKTSFNKMNNFDSLLDFYYDL